MKSLINILLRLVFVIGLAWIAFACSRGTDIAGNGTKAGNAMTQEQPFVTMKAFIHSKEDSLYSYDLLINNQKLYAAPLADSSNIRKSPVIYFDSMIANESVAFHINIYGFIQGVMMLVYESDAIVNINGNNDTCFTLILERTVQAQSFKKESGISTIAVLIICKTVPKDSLPDLHNYKSDSIAVQAILDMNGLSTVTVQSITKVDSNRITFLDLSGLGLSTLPRSIGEITALKDLSLSYNNLGSLPKEIGKLTSLVSLSISHNPITVLPDEIGCLRKLQILEAYHCSLTTLPSSIGQLKNLSDLIIWANSISSFPTTIGSCSNLGNVSANFNAIASLPVSIGRIPDLMILELSDNALSTFPNELCNSRGMYELILTNNPLGSLPDSIGNMSLLLSLDAANCGLSTLPESIVNITMLQHLDLSNNCIANLALPIKNWIDIYQPDWTGNQTCGK